MGINKVNPAAFPALAPLAGCENDAVSMRDIAVAKGFAPATLIQGEEAKFKNVVKKIEEAAATLNAGDIFLFTFAGHGCPTFDKELNLVDEPEQLDENIVLFDLMLLDDYLRRVLWPTFKEGVRIVAVADSCHSATTFMAASAVDSVVVTEHLAVTVSDGAGTVATVTDVHTVELFSLDDESHEAHVPRPAPPDEPAAADGEAVVFFRNRELPPPHGFAHLAANQPSYVEMKIPPLNEAPLIKASLLVLAACQDKGKTRDGFPHGAFTAALLEVWNGGAFSDYVTFMQQITNKIQVKFPNQIPALKPDVLPTFSGERPFTI